MNLKLSKKVKKIIKGGRMAAGHPASEVDLEHHGQLKE